MKDVLSQSEIDSLISALSSGKLEEKKIQEDELEYKPYDFRRPSKFSKEQIRTLQIIHDNYARILSNFLTAYLRVPVQIKIASVSQVTYEEFIFSLPVPTLMTVFNMSPEMGSAIIECNPQFVFPLIDLIFGGEGNVPPEMRELTQMEITVMRKVIIKMLENLRYVWEDIANISPHIETMDTNPQFNQMIASSETVALVTMTTQIKEARGFLNLCFPYITLEKIIPNLTAQYWFNQVQQHFSPANAAALEKRLEDVEIGLSVVMGRTVITLDDFLQFQEGDVVQLDRKAGEEMDLMVENQLLFKVQPGTSGSNLAVEITGWAAGANEEVE